MSKKNYFISFDAWNNEQGYNKFYCGIREMDFSEKGLNKYVMDIINDEFDIDVSHPSFTFKVNSLSIV